LISADSQDEESGLRQKLEVVSVMSDFDIAGLHEMMALLGQEDHSYRIAA